MSNKQAVPLEIEGVQVGNVFLTEETKDETTHTSVEIEFFDGVDIPEGFEDHLKQAFAERLTTDVDEHAALDEL